MKCTHKYCKLKICIVKSKTKSIGLVNAQLSNACGKALYSSLRHQTEQASQGSGANITCT